MVARLRELGYDEQAIGKMTPQQAHDSIAFAENPAAAQPTRPQPQGR